MSNLDRYFIRVIKDTYLFYMKRYYFIQFVDRSLLYAKLSFGERRIANERHIRLRRQTTGTLFTK